MYAHEYERLTDWLTALGEGRLLAINSCKAIPLSSFLLSYFTYFAFAFLFTYIFVFYISPLVGQLDGPRYRNEDPYGHSMNQSQVVTQRGHVMGSGYDGMRASYSSR